MTSAGDDTAWPTVDGETPLGELSNLSVVAAPAGATGGSRLLVLTIVAREGSAEVRYGWLGASRAPITRVVPARMQLAEFVARWSGMQLGDACIAPGVDWPSRRPAWVWLLPGPALLIFAFAVVTGTALAWGIVPFAIALTWYSMGRFAPQRTPQIAGPDATGPLPITEVQRRVHLRALDHVQTGRSTDRVNAVKETYGTLREDVIYRIENSALFDAAVPQTRDFHVALLKWDDGEDRSPAERARLAAEVQVSFDTARAHAERLGLDHLPATAQPVARRAAGALRLAQQSASQGERLAALETASRLLASLALYYLPDPQHVRELPPQRD